MKIYIIYELNRKMSSGRSLATFNGSENFYPKDLLDNNDKYHILGYYSDLDKAFNFMTKNDYYFKKLPLQKT
jgi:hypothetical protein